MSEGVHPGTGGDGPFEDLDPRLVVFALANGMDLSKGPEYRRLEWFTEGLERAILIEADGDGGYQVGVLAWPTGSEELHGNASVGGGLASSDIMDVLHSAIDAANGL